MHPIRVSKLNIERQHMYKAGQIAEEASGGWSIEILDPNGVVFCLIRYGHKGVLYGPHVDAHLKEEANTLLSHLNRD
jgi:hypothetical protein